MPDEKGHVFLIGKYGEWAAIKKMLVHPDTRKEEVALMLSAIAQTCARKQYQFSVANQAELDAKADGVLKELGMQKKGLDSALLALEKLNSSVLGLSGLDEISKSYLVYSLLEKLGYSEQIRPESLVKIYPNLKIAKPRGLFSKK